jgi:hypothetical protein
MKFADLPKAALECAERAQLAVIRAYTTDQERLSWARLLNTDAFLLEATRNRLAEWATRGGGKAENIIGETVGTMMGYGVEPERAMLAICFVLHGSKPV